MKKFKTIITKMIILMVLITITGCDSKLVSDINFKNEPTPKILMTDLLNRDYNFEIIDELDIESPSGIYVNEKEILVADSKGNRIIILGKEDKKIKKIIGRTGSAKGEFIGPKGIMVDNNGDIFVVDSGNNRVQIFDQEGEFKEAIDMSIFEKHNESIDSLKDIAVDDKNNIYVSVMTTTSKEAGIYMIDENRAVKQIGIGLYGHLTSYKGDIYFTSQVEFFENKTEIGCRTGENYLLKIKNGKIEKGYYLPNKYGPKDFCIIDGIVFTTTFKYIGLDRFDIEGKYKDTLFITGELDEEFSIESVTFDLDGNIYMTDSLKKCIYVININD